MSDYGTFMSNEYSAREDGGVAVEEAGERACLRLQKEPDVEEAVRLILKGGGRLSDVIDALTLGDLAHDSTFTNLREAFELGAFREEAGE